MKISLQAPELDNAHPTAKESSSCPWQVKILGRFLSSIQHQGASITCWWYGTWRWQESEATCIGYNKTSTGKDFLPKQLQGATDKVGGKKHTKVASSPNNIHNLWTIKKHDIEKQTHHLPCWQLNSTAVHYRTKVAAKVRGELLLSNV
jgi:hypothetical protein